MGVGNWEVLESQLLSDNWGEVRRTRLRITGRDGTVSEQWRETYDRGDGAVILPYDAERRHVLLGRQFRWPAAHAGDPEPFLIEAAAGLLDDAEPEARIRAEAEEELGLSLGPVTWLYALYSSPGSVTEKLHYFTAPYAAADATARFGGLAAEGEEIEIMDVPLSDALDWVRDGRIRDAKTVILLQHAALHLMPLGGVPAPG